MASRMSETSASSSSSSSSRNDDSVEVPSGRKRPRPKESKTYTIEWPSNGTEGEDNHQDLELNARVTFLQSPTPTIWTGEKLCLMGRAKIRCLEGSITILGHRLLPSQEMLPIESPPWSSLLVLEPNSHCESNQEVAAVIQVDSWWPQDAENHLEATFELVSSQTPGVRPTFVVPTWEHAMDLVLPDLTITTTPSHRSEPQAKLPNDQNDTTGFFRMAICGAKGVGKSTFLRYATNRILSGNTHHHHQVAILDADVGQPEMSPPGLVTLTLLSDPLLTPPHYRSVASLDVSSQHQHQFCYFFGSVTSKVDPQRYMQLLKRLIQHYEEDILSKYETHVPLLINLDGWVKGLGFELLSTILTEVLDPSHVIQIVGTTKSKQFQLREVLNPEVSKARLHVIHSYDSSLNFSPTTCPTPNNNNGEANNNDDKNESNNDDHETEALLLKVPASCVMPAQALRALRLCTYFLSDVTIWYNLGFNHEGIRDDTCEIAHRLAGALPYAVPFEAVEIRWEGSDHFSDLEDNFDAMLDTLNASIVGLACSPESDSDKDGDLLPCIGFGLVRAIDRFKKIYYILTPVEPDKLSNVNTLIGGNMEVPTEFWFRGVHAEAFPYQTFSPPSSVIGADPMKSRNTIGRKGLTNGNNTN
jgi:polynucleotide 5'-hydroxyl-kinase GRC3/NOL9